MWTLPRVVTGPGQGTHMLSEAASDVTATGWTRQECLSAVLIGSLFPVYLDIVVLYSQSFSGKKEATHTASVSYLRDTLFNVHKQ